MVIHPSVIGGCPILNTSTEVDDTNKAFSELAKSFVNEILETVEHILEEGKSTGNFKFTVEPKRDALFLYASFQGAILIGNLSKDLKPFLDIFNRVLIFLEESVFKKVA